MLKFIKDIKDFANLITEKERREKIADSLFPDWKITDESYSLVRTGRMPVIVIQGYMMKRESMIKIDNSLKNAGFAPVSFHIRRLGVDKGVEELSLELRMFLEIFIKNNFNGTRKNLRIPAIGFSMGGVILHYLLRAMDGCSFISRVITIASPVNGLSYAALAIPFKNIIRQLKAAYDLWEGSEFMKKLRKKPFPPSCYFISISSEGDWMAPPKSCILPDFPNTKNIVLKHLFHSDMPFSQKVTDLVMSLILETETIRDMIKYF